MALITPFRALRYNPAVVPNLAEVVAPPYDVISAKEDEQLQARSRYNCVRLILGRGDDPHHRAAVQFAAWREENVLLQDETPQLYLVEDRYRVRDAHNEEVERRRRGLICLVRIEDADAGVVLPHERTMAGPRDDRFRRMSAVNAQLSQVFMITPDKDGVFGDLCEEASKGETLADFTEDGGAAHRLVSIQEPNLVTRFQKILAERPLLIADGHHRYETARAYRDAKRAANKSEGSGPRPYDHVMALVASMDDPGTTVLGYHRLLRDLEMTPSALRERLGRVFDLKRVAAIADPGSGPSLLAAMEEAGSSGMIAFGIALRGDPELYLLSHGRNESDPPLARLDVTVLHTDIFENLLGMTEEDFTQQSRIDYASDPRLALERVATGSHAAAFLLNPTPPAEVMSVA